MSTSASNSAVEMPSVCPLDCPDTCSLLVTVEDDQITKVHGSKTNPLTAGVICQKVSKYYPEFVHGERRIRTPLKRVGKRGTGEYEPISWDEALDLCYQGVQKAIDQYGPETVLPLNYSGPHGQLAGGSMSMRFFYKLGATQLRRETLCAGVRSMAYDSLFGSSMGMPQEQAEHSDLIIIWGSDTSTSFLHLMKIIKRARNKGAKVIVIDPKRIKVARNADLYLQITPGTDAYLALAVAAELDKLGLVNRDLLKDKVHGLDEYLQQVKRYQIDKIPEICKLSDVKVAKFIDLLSNAKRVSMLAGVGLERTSNGGSAIRAAMSLPILLGQFGKLGQGHMGFYASAFMKNTDELQRPDLLKKPTRKFSIIDVSDHLLDSNLEVPIKAVFIYNHNPICTHPDQNKMRRALSQDDVFIVGSDITMTDSMKYADVILPAASHFEHDDVYASYGHTYLQRAKAIIPLVGEAKPNTEIFRLLSKRFGFEGEEFQHSDEQLQEQAFSLKDHPSDKNSVFEVATNESHVMGSIEHIWLSDLAGKINLYNEQLEKVYGYGLPRYESIKGEQPFMLLTPPSPQRSNSTFGGDVASSQLQEVEINTQDATAKGINNGQKVKLKNQKGEVVLIAKVSDDIAIGVLSSYKGAWCESSPTNQTVQALIDNHCKTDIGDGAAFYNTFVNIELVNSH